MTTESLPPRVVPDEVPFVDNYGDDRVIHRRSSGGYSVKRTSVTPILALNASVSRLVGQRVRHWRLERGLTLVELAHRIGAGSGNPKQRMWQIENPGRRGTGETYGGMRLGTIYAIALALNVDISDLIPSVDEIAHVAALASRPTVALR